MTRLGGKTRGGFTIVELLVVIAIIVVLIALILPAIQMARETANILACSNNLKNIGQAFMEASRGKYLPSGGWDPGLARNKSGMPPNFRVANGIEQSWGWAYQILPYLDQGNIFNEGQLVNSAAQQDSYFGSANQAVIKTYICPTRRAARLIQVSNTVYVAPIDYAGNGGPFTFWNPDGTLKQGPNGLLINDGTLHFGTVVKPFYWNGSAPVLVSKPIRFDDITDGQSYTLLVAEKRWNNVYDHSPYFFPQFSAQAATDFIGFTCGYGMDTIRTGGSSDYTASSFGYSGAYGSTIPRADDNNTGAAPPAVHPDGFGSAHARGFNALFADGSVRFLNYGMVDDPRTTPKYPNNPGVTLFQRMCDRNDSGLVDLRTTE